MPKVKVLNGEHKGKILETIEIFFTDNTVTCLLDNVTTCEFDFDDIEVVEE